MNSAFRLATAAMVASLATGVACSANSGSGDSDFSNGNTGNTGNTGSGAGSSNGGTIGLGGSGSINPGGDAGAAPIGCYQYDVVWEPKTPTVYIVLDRSSSMQEFGLWTPIRDAILPVVEKLQADVRFGFTAYTGTDNQTGCPDGSLLLDTVPTALANYDAINALYGPLEPPAMSETPTGPALDFVREQLTADTTPGDKFVLLVTDGQPDYCDNPTPKCAIDGVVRRIQELHAAGIRTLVFGFEGINNDNAAEVAGLTWALQSFANAGAGEPVGVQDGMTREQYMVDLTPGAVVFWDECSGYAPWKAEHDAAALAEWHPLGTYSAPAGATPVFKPNPTDQQALITEFESVLSGVKSCSFDLATEIEEGTLEIDLNNLGLVSVQVEGMSIPLDEATGQGWRMATETELVLEGQACDLWRQQTSDEIAFDFPCEVIVVIPK